VIAVRINPPGEVVFEFTVIYHTAFGGFSDVARWRMPISELVFALK